MGSYKWEKLKQIVPVTRRIDAVFYGDVEDRAVEADRAVEGSDYQLYREPVMYVGLLEALWYSGPYELAVRPPKDSVESEVMRPVWLIADGTSRFASLTEPEDAEGGEDFLGFEMDGVRQEWSEEVRRARQQKAREKAEAAR